MFVAPHMHKGRLHQYTPNQATPISASNLYSTLCSVPPSCSHFLYLNHIQSRTSQHRSCRVIDFHFQPLLLGSLSSKSCGLLRECFQCTLTLYPHMYSVHRGVLARRIARGEAVPMLKQAMMIAHPFVSQTIRDQAGLH